MEKGADLAIAWRNTGMRSFRMPATGSSQAVHAI
jgi:hypothetical protein